MGKLMVPKDVMEKKKYNKKELSVLLEFDPRHQQLVGIPNDIFQILSRDEQLKEVKAPHIAYAYTYVYLTAWLYKYGKYSLEFDVYKATTLKKIIGLSEMEKRYDYIFKKNGVLDRLEITKTVNFKDAAIKYVWEDGVFDGFVTYGEWLALEDPRSIQDYKDFGINLNAKHRKIKYPIFGLDKREVNGEEVGGTFFEFGNTHAVPMDVFIECMTNRDLGATAFYVYAYLYSRCGMNKGQIEVSLEKIKSITGLRHTTLNSALSSLKAFNLVKCYPATFVVNKGNYETGASVYEVIDKKSLFNSVPQNFIKRDVLYIETIK